MVSTIKTVQMPDASPQVARMMAGRSTTIRQCITPREAAGGGRERSRDLVTCGALTAVSISYRAKLWTI